MDMATAPNAAFTITRTFDAPRELVFAAWTEAEHLLKWFGPKGMAMASATSDPRPGGTMHYSLTMPDGSLLWGKWYYREVRPPEYLEVIATFSDAEGGLTRNPWKADWPLRILSRTTFTEEAGQTTIILEWSPFEAGADEQAAFFAPEAQAGTRGGWGSTLDKLESYLKAAGTH